MAGRGAWQEKPTGVFFLVTQNFAFSQRCPPVKPADIVHTIIPDFVHRMRQFWSMRSNKWQHAAQSLRFEWPPKRGIIRLACGYASAFAYPPALSDAEWKAQK